MMSFQTIYAQIQSLHSDSSSTLLTLIKQLVNQTQQYVVSFRKDVTEKSATDTTVASQQSYFTPYDYGKMFGVTVTVGDIAYPVQPVEDDDFWLALNARSSGQTSDIPKFYHIFADKLYLWPVPSSASNTITMLHHRVVRDMTAADYATGTITTLANGGTAVTGSATVWTAAMVGRYFKIDADSFWYEIASFSTTTSIALKKKYQGTAIAAGSSSYTIGEMPLLPESYHELLVWRPLAILKQQAGDDAKARAYWMLFDGGHTLGLAKEPGGMLGRFIADRGSKTANAVIPGAPFAYPNPNDSPLNLTG